MIRIVLADDHPVVLSGYRRLLERDGEMVVIGEAVDGDAAYQLCAQHEPDLLVSDIAMPGGGLDLLQRARRRVPSLRVLLFSMLDSALLVRRAFDAGAAGFLTTASPPQRLIDAVRALHAGRRYLDPELPQPPRWNAAGAAAPMPRCGEQDRLAELSAREFEVFRLLAEGCSAAECAERLHLSAKTVANHQSAIKDKLGVGTGAALVHLAMRHRVIAPPDLSA